MEQKKKTLAVGAKPGDILTIDKKEYMVIEEDTRLRDLIGIRSRCDVCDLSESASVFSASRCMKIACQPKDRENGKGIYFIKVRAIKREKKS